MSWKADTRPSAASPVGTPPVSAAFSGSKFDSLSPEVSQEPCMKYLSMGMAVLAAAFATSSAQDVPGQRDPQKNQPPGGWEVRVYLMDKDKKDMDLKDITATLMIEEKPVSAAEKATTKKTIPMQLVTPKPEDKMWHHGQVREIEGGQYFVEMMVHKAGMRAGGKGAYEKGAEDREKSGREKKTAEEGTARTHTGPYFKAEVAQDVAPKGEFIASVSFKIMGETKTATGFEYPFMSK